MDRWPGGVENDQDEDAENFGVLEDVDSGGAVIREGPEGIDDPDTEWDAPELDIAPIELSLERFLVLEPGEDPEVWDKLPKGRKFPFGVAARTGQLVLCCGRARTWIRMASGAPVDHLDAPIAAHMTVVFIAHRDKGRRTRPKEYLVVTDSFGGLLGWLDYSDTWSFNTRVLRQVATAGGLGYEVLRYRNESEFEQAHPDWVG